MKNKQKTKDTVIRKETRCQDGCEYCYTLLMKESTNVASYKIPLYSVNIDLKMADGERTNADAKEIFADAGKALDFFDKLVLNLATPIDLPYIIEDEFSR